jgi:hypothetical protein
MIVVLRSTKLAYSEIIIWFRSNSLHAQKYFIVLDLIVVFRSTVFLCTSDQNFYLDLLSTC